MSQNVRLSAAERDREANEIPRELAELGQLILSLKTTQQSELDMAFLRVVESVNRRRRILELVQESLSQLRLDIKYLMFDLESTRKERDELREQFEDR